MDDLDPRMELAGITRSLRRYIERERASGTGDLLARAAGRRGEPVASDAPAPPVPPTPAPARASRPTAAPVREPAPAAVVRAEAESVAPSGGVLGTGLEIGPAPLNSIVLGERAAIAAEAQPVLERIAVEVRKCEACALWQSRTQAVPGVGSALSGVVFVGEAPGADEDRKGEPFVGRAGQLLDKIIQAVDEQKLIPNVPLNRNTVFIGNVIKCRPPENRTPLPVEVEHSSPFLLRQLAALKPRIIVCLGKTAAELLVGVKGSLGAMRGRVYRYQGAKLIVTYHPAALLRNPGWKRPVWEDMQMMAREYQSED